MADDLDTPLKAKQNGKPPRKIPARLSGVLAAAFACVFLFAIGWIAFSDDPLGGEPRHVVKIEQIIPTQESQTKSPERKSAETKPAEPTGDQRTVTIIDGNTGARREVVINNAKSAPDTRPAGPKAKAANEQTSSIPPADNRLVETSRHGPIPKIGADGVRPLEAYASPIPVTGTADSMIAIVITGLGVSAANTEEAITKLPAAVTLGFVPFGGELTRAVAKARLTGHEVLLQIPMEPLDYPDNDPGPQTLTVKASKDQNIDRLHFFLSRSQGYVGVANLMGARFTANEEALSAILAETGSRGLLFLDDGTSPRSATQRAAVKTKSPVLKSDIVIDSKTEWADIDAALVKLEAIAVEKGVAVATASSLPVTIERIARWAKTLEARGIRLVPVSAAFQRLSKQS